MVPKQGDHIYPPADKIEKLTIQAIQTLAKR
jgi:hypothetical protein